MFMKLVAHHWLYEVVFPTVKKAYKDKKSFEVDSKKAEKCAYFLLCFSMPLYGKYCCFYCF